MHDFEDIRPFYDEEVKPALQELMHEPEFTLLLNYLFPGADTEELCKKYCYFNSVYEFQSQFAYYAIKKVTAASISSLTFSGLEKLNKDTAYLFLSNHRDIVLDPGLLSLILFENGFPIPQQAIGSNLLVSPTVTKLFRLNRSFIVQRNESPKQMYAAWKKLSAYIYHVITQRKENLWIAQREGRAKDGDDRTQTGILKMFLMNFDMEYQSVIRNLNIIPVSITYEFDPCDYLKALELYHVRNNLPFVKDDDFNLNSMLTGLQGYKGRVHLAIGTAVSELLNEEMQHENHRDWIQWLAGTIDAEIHRNYHLFPSHYIAYDLLNETPMFSGHYSGQEKEYFTERLENQLKDAGPLRSELRKLMLVSYANSVINHHAATKG